MDRERLLTQSLPGIFLVIATLFASSAYLDGKSSDALISVTGSAQRRIVSNQSRWTVRLERNGDLSTLKEGNAQLASDLAALLGYIKKAGISGSGVTVQPVLLSTLTNYNAGPIPTGYQLSQVVVVESPDVRGMTQLAAGSTNLVSHGAMLSTVSLDYVYTKLQDVRIAMLGEATKNARDRAEQIAENAGVSLGKLRSASMGVFQITSVNSTDIIDAGTYDTSSIEKQVTAIVRASFDHR